MATETLHIIALRTIRHSDSRSILTAYSREHGRMSFAVPAGKGRSASRISALTMPLSFIECTADVRPGREISTLRSPAPALALTTVHSNPLKQMTAMFLAEILAVILRESQGDEAVFRFIENAVRLLDIAEGRSLANFNLWFLYNLGRLLGIEPDTSTYAPGSLLDLRDGVWRAGMALHPDVANAVESSAVWRLSRMTVTNMHLFRYTRQERNMLLDGILRYYTMHLVSLSGLKSLDILRSMF